MVEKKNPPSPSGHKSPFSSRQINAFNLFILSLFERSEKIIKQTFNKTFPVDLKQDLSPVTRADKEIEELMRNKIQRHYPGHSIVREEYGIEDNSSDISWILDPIDGIKSFVCGGGGIISDYYGRDAVTSTSSVASSKELHPQVIDILRQGYFLK